MYSQIAANKRKTIIVMAVFVLFVAFIDWLLTLYFRGSNAMFAFILAITFVYVAIMYFRGSRLALAVNGAREIQKGDNPRLWRIIENLSITDGLPMPRVFIMDDPAPNAFATGRDPNHAAVCATTGLLNIMDDSELQGVFAHELGHVKNYDIRVAMIAFGLSAVISLLADIILNMTLFRNNDREDNSPLASYAAIVAIILAPLIATLIQLAVSRSREYLADATGVMTTRYPEGLISALQKIEQTGSVTKKQNTATAHLFFANPLKGHSVTSLFSTHPPIAERIERLQRMGSQA